MATQKGKANGGKLDEIIQSGEAPATHGPKKRYLADHRVIWNPEKDRPLIVAEGKNEEGRSVIETSDPNIQKKLENLGYRPDVVSKTIHPGKGKAKFVKSAEQVERENAQ